MTYHPDAPLLDACAAFDVLERRSQALAAEVAVNDELIQQIDEITDRQRPLLNIIVEHRACSLEAARARAASLALWARLTAADKDDTEDWEARLWRAVVRDLAKTAVARGADMVRGS